MFPECLYFAVVTTNIQLSPDLWSLDFSDCDRDRNVRMRDASACGKTANDG
ncbi:GD25301 [Drosophila simulans]|uniref:GD25301 n=1 Tax=Drosophila simulans TaxID=7240 RepID=B4QEJ1_DROSI|nr:GD25301 [Drosophila simulans]